MRTSSVTLVYRGMCVCFLTFSIITDLGRDAIQHVFVFVFVRGEAATFLECSTIQGSNNSCVYFYAWKERFYVMMMISSWIYNRVANSKGVYACHHHIRGSKRRSARIL